MKKYKKYIAICVSTFVIAGGVFIGETLATHNNITRNKTEAATIVNNEVTTQPATTQIETTTTEPTSIEETTTTAIKKIKKIKLNKDTARMVKGKKLKLKATISYKKSKATVLEKVRWTTSNSNIATVSGNGKVKALSAGKVIISCKNQNGKINSKCEITIINPYRCIKKITLDKDAMRMNPGDSRKLSFTATYKGKKSHDKEPVIWKSSNKKIATVDKNGVVKGKTKGKTYITVKGKYSKKSFKCKVTVKDTKYIAFTFDDGPGIHTDKLLNALQKHHSKATFFVLGNLAGPYKDVLKREYSCGMEIGSHTYSHQNLKAISKKDIISEITKAREAIFSATGHNPTLLRPPYGNFNKTVSKHAGVPMIFWSVDTLDWKYRNTKYVCKTILNQSNAGAIVLLHDIHETSVNGFIKALPKLRKKGFELVTVSELYELYGKELKDGVMHYGPTSSRQ